MLRQIIVFFLWEKHAKIMRNGSHFALFRCVVKLFLTLNGAPYYERENTTWRNKFLLVQGILTFRSWQIPYLGWKEPIVTVLSIIYFIYPTSPTHPEIKINRRSCHICWLFAHFQLLLRKKVFFLPTKKEHFLSRMYISRSCNICFM